jgi:hypothetical protein
MLGFMGIRLSAGLLPRSPRLKWRTEVRRYNGKPKATAARFEETEPAATNSKAKSKSKAPT